MSFETNFRPSSPIKRSAITKPMTACLFLNVTENSSSLRIMPHRSRSIIIAEALYQILWATAASLFAIVLLILAASCAAEHGPDTPQKFDSAGNPNFGPR